MGRCEILPDNYFVEYYRPRVYTSFKRLFSFNMLGTNSKGPLVKDVVSPFTIRVNPQQQQQKQFMMYTLNIGGVKRWLALNREHGDDDEDDGSEFVRGYTSSPPAEVPDDSSVREVREDQDWYGTAALTSRLFRPQVRETEMKEYQRYVWYLCLPRYTRQFQSDAIHRSKNPQNSAFYAAYLVHDSNSLGSETAKRDELLYINYCDIISSKNRVVKRATKKEASYRAYLESGVYLPPAAAKKATESKFLLRWSSMSDEIEIVPATSKDVNVIREFIQELAIFVYMSVVARKRW